MQHHEHVGAHLVSSVGRARKDEPAADVLARLAAEKPACAELVLAVDRHGRLEGAVPLTRLIVAPDGTLLKRRYTTAGRSESSPRPEPAGKCGATSSAMPRMPSRTASS